MVRNIILTEESAEVADEVIEIVFDKVGIKLNTKELVMELFQDPKKLSEIIIQNFKKRIVT
jgi:hypothetical protein